MRRVSKWRINILQASALVTDICRNIHTAANSVDNTEYTVVLRGDSTLRGHFPEARMVTYVTKYDNIVSLIMQLKLLFAS